jgi:hypothetical protein
MEQKQGETKVEEGGARQEEKEQENRQKQVSRQKALWITWFRVQGLGFSV